MSAVLSLIASSVVWGLTWWPLKYFAQLGLDGHAIALVAYGPIALAALPFVWRERAQWRSERRLLFAIALFFGLANFALNLALMSGSVVRVMLFFFLLPAWGVIGGRIFLKEALDGRRLLAVLLCLGGVFTIVGGVEVFSTPWSLADLAALVAGIAYTLGGIANRASPALPIVSRTLASFIGCSALGVVGLLLHVPAIPPLQPADWGMLLLFAAAWIGGATLLTTIGVTHLPAGRVGVLQVVELAVAIVSAVWVGGEALSATEMLGAAMIAAATVVEALGMRHE